MYFVRELQVGMSLKGFNLLKNMEYHRTKTGQIYADIAYRLGRIVIQYEKMSLEEEKFQPSLYIAVLQNLLTNCCEHVRQITRQHNFIFQQDIETVGWGLNKGCWVENKYEEVWNLENFIKRLRNALSHPRDIIIESDYPSTGYTTIRDNSDMIRTFRFVDSPDTLRNQQRIFKTEQEVTDFIRRNKNSFPESIHYGYNGSGFFLSLDEAPFIRITVIDLSVEELASFVKHLANFLAQPIQKNWDGKTTTWLLVA
jgi:hypothetical protein